MALPPYIPTCIRDPPGPYHFPPPDRPLRIQIDGPLVAIKRLLPHIDWQTDLLDLPILREGGVELANLAFRKIYRRDVYPENPNDLVVRDEYTGFQQKWVVLKEFDYYGVTFDNFVPDDDPDPEVMQINVIEVETDNGVNANQYLDLTVDPDEFIGKKVLAVPRCCQKRKGTTDRMRANDNVERRLRRLSWEEFVERCLKKGSNKVPETLNPAKS